MRSSYLHFRCSYTNLPEVVSVTATGEVKCDPPTTQVSGILEVRRERNDGTLVGFDPCAGTGACDLSVDESDLPTRSGQCYFAKVTRTGGATDTRSYCLDS